MRVFSRFILLLLGASAAGCGDDAPPPPAGGCGAGQAASTVGRVLSGSASYERVPALPTGLDYAHQVRLPIRGAVVELLAAGSTLATTTSDDSGRFSLSWTGPAVVTVRVKAQTLVPAIRVEDPTAGNALYSLDSCIDSAATTPELLAASGWGGSSYTSRRASAPFAILDALYTASRVFLAQRPVNFTPVSVSWSPSGATTAAHYDRIERRIELAGLANQNTDEFDAQLIVHEWGHHFIHTLSRSDDDSSVGVGGHGFNVIQDPRVSWNEGWATAVNTLVFPGSDYLDTYGPGQQQAVRFHAEDDDNGLYDLCPGWVSENGVIHVLADLFDASSSAEAFDGITLTPGEVYDLMVGPQRETEAFTTIFSFLEAVKARHPGIATQVEAIATRYGIHGTDAWGTGETNDAPGTCVEGGTPSSPGVEGLLPVYHWLEIGGPPAQLLLTFDAERFIASATRFAAFVGTGSPVSLIADGSGRALLLELFEAGAPRGTGVRQGDGTYLLRDAPTTAGKRYTVALSGPGNAGSYSWPVTLQATD
jgi:hypothetical protein